MILINASFDFSSILITVISPQTATYLSLFYIQAPRHLVAYNPSSNKVFFNNLISTPKTFIFISASY